MCKNLNLRKKYFRNMIFGLRIWHNHLILTFQSPQKNKEPTCIIRSQYSLFYTREVVDSSTFSFHVKVKRPCWTGASRKVNTGYFIKPDMYWRLVYIYKPSFQGIQKTAGSFVRTSNTLCTWMTLYNISKYSSVIDLAYSYIVTHACC